MANELETLCSEVLAARSAKDELKSQLAAADKELSKLEASLATLIGAEDGNKISHEGFTFSATSTVNWKTVKDGKDKLLQLLKQGAPELVKESVNSATLSAFLRKNESTLDDSNPEWWTSAKNCLERSEKQSLSVRKGKKK